MNKNCNSMEELVSKAATGDQFAWSALYNETFREAYFIAKKIVGNEEDAVELVQDAFVAAFEKLSQLKDRAKFRSWLNMIVANKCRNYLSKNKPLLFTEVSTADEDFPEWADDRDYGQPEISFDKNETVRLVAEIVDSLPEDQKLCAILYYWDDQSIAQIAEALDVSEGTVKSRLSYARKKIKTSVEELDRKGVKLRGIAPLPLLIWLLKMDANAMEISSGAIIAPPIASAAITSVAKTGMATATAAGTTAKTVALSLVGKVVAGIATLSIAIGGIVLCINNYTPSVPGVVGSQAGNSPSVDSASEAMTMYEDLLRIGNTESGLKIAYYAYVDLDHDEIPELLVSDADGTPDSWSACEVYTYRDSTLHCCGSSSAHYDYFYLVNGDFILGKHRMGAQFISTNNFIETTIYHWDNTMTRNDPAISYNHGEWEYITQEEFEFYQTMPNESDSGFIQTAEIIKLKKNTSAQPNLVEEHMNYTDAWGFFATLDGNDLYFLSMVFNEYGRMDCVLNFAMDNQPVEPMGFYKGSYIAFKDTFTIKLDDDGDSCVYRFDPDTFTLTQVSEKGLFRTHKIGDTFTLVKDVWNEASQIQNLVEENYVDF